jgi:hypothetical protein
MARLTARQEAQGRSHIAKACRDQVFYEYLKAAGLITLNPASTKRERELPLPSDVKNAVDEFLKLDQKSRAVSQSDCDDAYLFQLHTNYRPLIVEMRIRPVYFSRITA